MGQFQPDSDIASEEDLHEHYLSLQPCFDRAIKNTLSDLCLPSTLEAAFPSLFPPSPASDIVADDQSGCPSQILLEDMAISFAAGTPQPPFLDPPERLLELLSLPSLDLPLLVGEALNTHWQAWERMRLQHPELLELDENGTLQLSDHSSKLMKRIRNDLLTASLASHGFPGGEYTLEMLLCWLNGQRGGALLSLSGGDSLAMLAIVVGETVADLEEEMRSRLVEEMEKAEEVAVERQQQQRKSQ